MCSINTGSHHLQYHPRKGALGMAFWPHDQFQCNQWKCREEGGCHSIGTTPMGHLKSYYSQYTHTSIIIIIIWLSSLLVWLLCPPPGDLPLQGIFPTQRMNPCLLCLLHCRRVLYQQCYLGSPKKPVLVQTFPGSNFCRYIIHPITNSYLTNNCRAPTMSQKIWPRT